MKMQQKHLCLNLGLDSPVQPFIYPDFLDCLFAKISAIGERRKL